MRKAHLDRDGQNATFGRLPIVNVDAVQLSVERVRMSGTVWSLILVARGHRVFIRLLPAVRRLRWVLVAPAFSLRQCLKLFALGATG